MSLLDYLETQNMLDKIAMERGAYCYDYVKTLEKKLAVCEKALVNISHVNQYDADLGQLIGSEHYEAAWLDCIDIAQKALADLKGTK